MKCLECNAGLDKNVYAYSIKNFGAPLCRTHQDWVSNSNGTRHAINLYFGLRKNGVPAQLEKSDGYKTIDIAVPECKVNIEVDGIQHHLDPKQALADLQRTYYSFLKGYVTLRIPNNLVKSNIDDTVNYIVEILSAGAKRKWSRHW